MKSRIRTRDLLIQCFLASGTIAFLILLAALDGSLTYHHRLGDFVKSARVAAPNDSSVCKLESAGDRGSSVAPQEPPQRDTFSVALMEQREVLLGDIRVNPSEVLEPDCTGVMRSQLTISSARPISHRFNS